MKRKVLVTSVMMVLGITAAYGKECKGILFPDYAQVQGNLLTLNGLGLRKASLFKISVYVVALYLTDPSNDPHVILQSNTPSELVLQFIRGVSAKELRNSWEEGFARNSPGHPPELEEGLAQLNGWVVDVKRGQRMTFIRIPGTGLQVDINGTMRGTIE
jgi:Chalcone isomerase-like